MLRLSFLLTLIFFSSCFSARKIPAGDYSSCEIISRAADTDTGVHSGTIRVLALDKASHDTLAGCTVLLLNKSGKMVMGALTDFDGKATLYHVPYGTYQLKIMLMGYETLLIDTLKLKNENLELNFSLRLLTMGTIPE